MADVATRTSVNATFQVLPPHQRLAAQVGVEGAGVPIALGFTAALILTIDALWESSVLPIIVATMVICLAWCAISLVVYQRYRDAAVVAARRRMLDDVLVDVAEPATRDALLAMAQSDTPRDIALAVNLLTAAEVDEAEQAILEAAGSDRIEIRHAVLHHLLDRHPLKALEVAAACVTSFELRHKLDGLRTLGILGRAGGEEVVTVAAGHLLAAADHADGRVRSVALGALLGTTDEPAPYAVAAIDPLIRSTDVEDRVLAAQSLGEAGTEYAVRHLVRLLDDPDPRVRTAAITAVGELDDSHQAGIFSQLLTANQDSTVDRTKIIGEFLRRSAGRSGPRTCDVVVRWLPSADPALTSRATRFLASNGWSLAEANKTDGELAAAVDAVEAVDGVISNRIAVAASAAGWLAELTTEDGPAVTSPTSDRLWKAVVSERAEAQRQLIDALALIYDPQLLQRVRQLWSHRHRSAGSVGDHHQADHAMAREALELLLDQRHRAPVLEALADVPDRDHPACSLRAVRRLAGSPEWALEADWLQATALAVLVEADDSSVASPATFTPATFSNAGRSAGPIAQELLDHAR